MKINVRRILSAIMLLGCVITIYQLFSKPQPVALPQNPEITRNNAASFDQKLQQLETPRPASGALTEVHFSSDEVSAVVAQSTSTLPGASSAAPKTVGTAPSTPDATLAPGDAQVKGYQIKLEGDVARGQFVTEIAGKDVYVTLAGHLGSQAGYVTFDPTEFKIGDLNIPVSLVNAALQKKLAEQREQLKLPEGVAGLRVENGELVITPR